MTHLEVTPLEAARKGTITPEMRRVSERENATPEFIRDEVISTKDSLESHSREQLPNSKRVYVAGTLYPDVRVPMREVELAPTSFNDALKPNEPVRLYDCSGLGAIRISPAIPKPACPRCVRSGSALAATSPTMRVAK